MNEWSKAIPQVNGRAEQTPRLPNSCWVSVPGTTLPLSVSGRHRSEDRGSTSLFRMDLHATLGRLFKNKQKNNHKSACIDFHMCERGLILNIGLYTGAGTEEKKQSDNTDMSLLEKCLRLKPSQ